MCVQLSQDVFRKCEGRKNLHHLFSSHTHIQDLTRVDMRQHTSPMQPLTSMTSTSVRYGPGALPEIDQKLNDRRYGSVWNASRPEDSLRPFGSLRGPTPQHEAWTGAERWTLGTAPVRIRAAPDGDGGGREGFVDECMRERTHALIDTCDGGRLNPMPTGPPSMARSRDAVQDMGWRDDQRSVDQVRPWGGEYTYQARGSATWEEDSRPQNPLDRIMQQHSSRMDYASQLNYTPTTTLRRCQDQQRWKDRHPHTRTGDASQLRDRERRLEGPAPQRPPRLDLTTDLGEESGRSVVVRGVTQSHGQQLPTAQQRVAPMTQLRSAQLAEANDGFDWGTKKRHRMHRAVAMDAVRSTSSEGKPTMLNAPRTRVVQGVSEDDSHLAEVRRRNVQMAHKMPPRHRSRKPSLNFIKQLD